MGYNIYIGNAEPYFEIEGDELIAGWTIKAVLNESAPAFPGDEMSHHVNSRFPSYSAWAEMAREAGLTAFFYDKETGLFRKHPGCVKISREHLAQVIEAEERLKTKNKLPPGFGDGYDYELARVSWLRWWMEWALANCEVPAIYNS